MMIRYTDEAGNISIEEGIDNPVVEPVPPVPANEDTGAPAVPGFNRVVGFKIDKVTGMRSGSAFIPRPELGSGTPTVEILTDSSVLLQKIML